MPLPKYKPPRLPWSVKLSRPGDPERRLLTTCPETARRVYEMWWREDIRAGDVLTLAEKGVIVKHRSPQPAPVA